MDNILLNDIVDIVDILNNILDNIFDDILDILNNILVILFQTYEAEEGERRWNTAPSVFAACVQVLHLYNSPPHSTLSLIYHLKVKGDHPWCRKEKFNF